VASFGDGYVGGFLGRYRPLPDAELETLARLNAFIFAALGVNVALGPTVDGSTAEPRIVERARLVLGQMKRYGLAPVLKHFPALPPGANLHKETPDTRIPAALLAEREAVFRALAPDAGMMMTTHLLDSLVDATIVTFSSAWIAILRGQTGFGGLLISDGLLMLRNYADRTMLSGGAAGKETAGVDQAALWAARAILAGHDMVIVEGSAAQTTRVFDGLLTLACAGTTPGNALAGRIEQSWERIVKWKAGQAAALRRTVDVPGPTVQSIIALLPGAASDPAGFRFDRAALARLAPVLSAAELTP
jgi:beta-glucosidase-like glycosyl hydrolase